MGINDALEILFSAVAAVVAVARLALEARKENKQTDDVGRWKRKQKPKK